MKQVGLFDDISEEKINRMIHCFKPETRRFEKGESIMFYSQEPEMICILLHGRAHLNCVDRDGEETLLEHYSENDIFGEAFDLPYGEYGYTAEADSDCEVMFIPFRTICGRCSNACDHHAKLSENLFRMTAQKAQMLALRINIISKKSVRQRLATYLEIQRERAGKGAFEMEMTWSELAEYLCVDRTSLMRELRVLREEKIISTTGKTVTFNLTS